GAGEGGVVRGAAGIAFDDDAGVGVGDFFAELAVAVDGEIEVLAASAGVVFGDDDGEEVADAQGGDFLDVGGHGVGGGVALAGVGRGEVGPGAGEVDGADGQAGVGDLAELGGGEG